MPELEPDYSKYSREELHSVLSWIDREKYPERVRRVREAILRLKTSMAKKPELELREKDSEPMIILLISEVAFWLIVILLCVASV